MCFRPPSFDEMMKTCPNCGSFNDPSNAKCKKCGNDLPESGGDPATMPAVGAPKGPMAPKGPAGPMAPKGPSAPSAPSAPMPPKAQ